MTEDADSLEALRRILSPHCRATRTSNGALIADWRRTRFLGMTTADLRGFADGGPGDRARLVAGLSRAGCATARPKEYSDREVGLWLRGVHLTIRALGFGRVLRLLSLAAPDYVRADPPAAEEVARLKRAVQSLGRESWLIDHDCKTEAVTAYLLLRRRGLAAVLHVGVREPPLALHTWTSSAGLCVPDADPRGRAFAPVLSIAGGGQ
ncbi:lasso peptide biosynthesis B2 protein [Streptomyces sp. NPDC017936]|uniref:lasso peptide biosynthesis B2 protein n=1 Tax=Streptomyces sp. NPDC017936 TaxID=3365016 RepID=UPI0037A731D4